MAIDIIKLTYAIPARTRRFLAFFLSDVLVFTIALCLSFLLRFDFAMAPHFEQIMTLAIPLFLAIKLITFLMLDIYNITWRYVGIMDLFNIIKALIVAQLILILFITLPVMDFLQYVPPYMRKYLTFREQYLHGFPRSVLVIDFILSLIMISGTRLSKRLYYEVIGKRKFAAAGKRTIIVGAGNTGEMILRDILKQKNSGFIPVAFIDDDVNKVGVYIHGVKVFGPSDELQEAVATYNASTVIIAIPSLNYKDLRRLYNLAQSTQAKIIKVVPRIYDFQRPDVKLKSIEEIKIEDLIGRQVVEVDYEEIRGFLEKKIILITGSGGSIGSEITKQICSFEPERLVLFDIDETELHNLQVKLAYLFPDIMNRLSFVVGDVRDEKRLEEVFKATHPHIVFHTAAYKHVPMMESNEGEAVKVNMFGTYSLARLAVKYGVEKFVLISTDKAVRPTSVMGATKRMAEYICRAFNDSGATQFISVRFGNVLGSRGSVLPFFLEQLRHGGPLTVTHKDINRFFMTVQEAVSLVLQASVIGVGGNVLVLDMGDSVKIVDLAEELIKIHGFEPYKDIDIQIVGLRPGEKIFEEILTSKEESETSKHKRIFIAKGDDKYTLEEIEKILENFTSIVMEPYEGDTVKLLLRKYVTHHAE